MTITSPRIESEESCGGTAGARVGGRLRGARGRHRRPRPRKVLLAAGGLALAAGALSLVRLIPDAPVGAYGTAEADPVPDSEVGGGTDTGRSTNATASAVPAAPSASPTSTSVMGRVSASPTTTAPLPSSAATAGTPAPVTVRPEATAVHTARDSDGADDDPPDTPTAPAAPAPPAPPSTAPPAPKPAPPGQPGLCVPVIALCVDGLGAPLPVVR